MDQEFPPKAEKHRHKRKRLEGDAKRPPPSHYKPSKGGAPKHGPSTDKGAGQAQAPRQYTVSVAIAGSIIDNAQSMELKTYLVGEIARSLAIYQVDEVVIYVDESGRDEHGGKGGASAKGSGGPGWNPNNFFARLLQYVETPQYLRKALFPHHPDLRLAGILNPLDAPHHLRATEMSQYREGVTKAGNGGCSWVDVGLKKDVQIDRALKPNVRVTVQLEPGQQPPKTGKAVSPSAPRESHGQYWGYSTRLARGLTTALAECPFEGGYDLTIGTSERGHVTVDDGTFSLPPFKHLLIVFGGVAGLEACVEADKGLDLPGQRTHELFDMWLNICPNQGSRTIRTEEAILIGLARLRPHIMLNRIPG